MTKEILDKLCNLNDLSEKEVNFFFSELMSGNLSEGISAAILVALKIKKPSKEEIFYASNYLLNSLDLNSTRNNNYIDLCGTGGDGKSSINVSTISSLILSSLDVKVAKHGNRSVSSNVGSADLFEALNVSFDKDYEDALENIKNKNLTFLFAPNFHSSMKNVAKIRKDIATRTIFNVLGPLINPLKPSHQLLGVYDSQLLEPIAETLMLQGLNSAMVVHSFDGMDEISISDKTHVIELRNDKISKYVFNPTDYGFTIGNSDKLVIKNVEESKNIFLGIIKGEIRDERRDICVLNSGAGLYLTNDNLSLSDCFENIKEKIDSGHIYNILKERFSL
ncbi:MAG: anthranilate phosphoribosyltransferase [bacterium]|tara:strand:+ start:2954 stop:3958 length:1005 start_codon:yes stop_codon:yes gene_type:complete